MRRMQHHSSKLSKIRKTWISCSTLLLLLTFPPQKALSFQLCCSRSARQFRPIPRVEIDPCFPLSQCQKQQKDVLGRSFRRKASERDADDKNVGQDLVNRDSKSPDNWTWILTLVVPLWLVYISNQWSRYSISYLVDFSSSDDGSVAAAFTAMNVDIGFDQVQYGLLASVAFTCLYAIASLFAGVAADRFDRKLLTIVSCVAWSIATLGTALSDDYTLVVLWRIAMGLACAFSTPTAYTLIQQNAPPNRVALGSSLYGTGVALGSGLSSLSILLDSAIGWRQTELVISAIGFGAAALCTVLLPSDPKKDFRDFGNLSNPTNSSNPSKVQSTSRENSPEEQQNNVGDVNRKHNGLVHSFLSSTGSDVMKIVAISRVQWLYLASFLRFCSGISIGVWGAPYFRMAFPDNQQQYSIAQAAISAIGASASGILGGAAADFLSDLNSTITLPLKTPIESLPPNQGPYEDDPVGRKLLVPVIGSFLAAPTWYMAVHSGVGEHASFQLAMLWLAVEYFVAECWFGPTISSLQTTVGPKVGGTAQGMFSLTGAAANAAPALLGYFYGQAAADPLTSNDALSGLLIAGVCFGYMSSAFCFFMASQVGSPPKVQKSNL